MQVKDKDYFPVVLVANKCDLDYERQVDPQGMLRCQRTPLIQLTIFDLAEGSNLAKQFGAVCIETSAKQRINVDEVFMELVRAIRRYNKVRLSHSPPSRIITQVSPLHIGNISAAEWNDGSHDARRSCRQWARRTTCSEVESGRLARRGMQVRDSVEVTGTSRERESGHGRGIVVGAAEMYCIVGNRANIRHVSFSSLRDTGNVDVCGGSVVE